MTITLFYITINSSEAAQRIADEAIEKKLAGCANIFTIDSVFPWEEKMQHEGEHVLLLKTIPALKKDLEEFVLSVHPYDIPCIMTWDVDVNEAYGNWITCNVLSN
jgi:periplasmic divalent cation tolerance protein